MTVYKRVKSTSTTLGRCAEARFRGQPVGGKLSTIAFAALAVLCAELPFMPDGAPPSQAVALGLHGLALASLAASLPNAGHVELVLRLYAALGKRFYPYSTTRTARRGSLQATTRDKQRTSIRFTPISVATALVCGGGMATLLTAAALGSSNPTAAYAVAAASALAVYGAVIVGMSHLIWDGFWDLVGLYPEAERAVRRARDRNRFSISAALGLAIGSACIVAPGWL